MAKVVILGGNARSGKSTLSHMLVEKGFIIISFDIIQNVIEETFGIEFDKLDNNTRFNFFEKIVDKYIEESTNNSVNVVIDMYDYLPEDISKLQNKDKVEVYFLAYPSCTEEEIKYNVRHYAKPTDWIAQVNDKYFESCVKRFYERNQMLVEECNKYGVTLVDTKSGELRNQVLEDLVNKIGGNNEHRTIL